MPRVLETPVKGFAHCSNGRCPGSNQQRVDAVRVVTETTFAELGGDLPFVERSFEQHRFAQEDDRPCPSCGKSREVTSQQRPSYVNLSGKDPMGLLGSPGFQPGKRAPESEEQIEQRVRARLLEEQIEQRVRREMEE